MQLAMVEARLAGQARRVSGRMRNWVWEGSGKWATIKVIIGEESQEYNYDLLVNN